MSTFKWIIVKDPNMREERFLSGLAPIDWSYEKEDAMKFGEEQVSKISRLLLARGIPHALRQTY